MLVKPKLKMNLVANDDLDQENTHYLYEVWNGNFHYYLSTSSKEKDELNPYTYKNLIERKDMTDEEWHIAKTLFNFLWYSDNGTNTCMCYDQLKEENISKAEVEAFIKKFELDCEVWEEDGVEIYWEFLCSFDLNSCDFFDTFHKTQLKKIAMWMLSNALLQSYNGEWEETKDSIEESFPDAKIESVDDLCEIGNHLSSVSNIVFHTDVVWCETKKGIKFEIDKSYAVNEQ